MFPATVKSLLTEISYMLALPLVILRVPLKDKSFVINNLFFIVASSSTNALAPTWISFVNTLEPTPPIIALWGIVSSA